MIDSDEEKYRMYAEELRLCVADAAEPWLRSVIEPFGVGDTVPGPDSAIADVVAEIDRRLAELAAADPDEARSGPLELVRQSTGPLQRWLANVGVPAPVRDAWDVRSSPDDTYSLGPMAFTDLSEDVHRAGITWGAAKAHIHLRRRNPPPSGQSA